MNEIIREYSAGLFELASEEKCEEEVLEHARCVKKLFTARIKTCNPIIKRAFLFITDSIHTDPVFKNCFFNRCFRIHCLP